jgi:hypothetical protein
VSPVHEEEVEVTWDEVVVRECEVMLTFDAEDGKRFFSPQTR